MQLHPLLKLDELFNGTGKRAADIDYVQHLQRALFKIDKILMVAAKRRCADIVTADVENNGVPVKNKSRRYFCRQR